MSATAALSVDSLRQRHPEWSAWLALHRVVRDVLHDIAWAAAVPSEPGANTPLVNGATFVVDGRLVARYVDALLLTAGGRAIGEHATLTMLEAAIGQDSDRLATLASAAGIEQRLMAAVAPLAASPLMQACARAWRVPADADGAACPVCGAWATVMEARGVERVHRFRCACCGADWPAEPLRCPYCDERDHDKLVSLVSEARSDLRRVDACTACLGYVKSVTALSACAPEDVALLDLATVDLDVAALAHGYARPARPLGAITVRVVARPRSGLRRLLARRP